MSELQWTRRHWMIASGLGMAMRPWTLSAGAEGASGLDIIDCHTHFYDPSRPEGVPWPRKDSSLYRTVLPKHLRALKMHRPVTGTVIVEASPLVEDNAWLLDLAKKEPFIVGIVGNLDPLSEDYAANVQRFAANPLFRGIRISVKTLGTLLDTGNLTPLKLLADHDLSLDVNGGPDTPGAIAKLAPLIPELRIVLNHIGNVRINTDPPPAEWSDAIQAAAQHPNVFTKISGLVEGAARGGQPVPHELNFYRPYLDIVWGRFGNDRVIFGSNWPVSERAADYETLQRIVMEYATEQGPEVVQKFCSRNAARAYKWVERPGRRPS
ncbi:amidohydrolase family protein [Rubinisphaera margarita]|uniref:amidohydrolase family protein n=1 Tax=Rubinisphaera margarita TaxID=2909586 RepID=UPI001EE907BB|nr:amidohydrolase family protein [Rubinisphaera margarita]MCG6156495.1 amidohydrolase family protein [Rubinisphaera margarita]